MKKDFYYGVGHGKRPDGRLDLGAQGADGRYEHHEVHQIAAEVANAAERCGLTYRIEGEGTDSDAEDPNYVGSINNVNNDPGGYRCAIEGHFDWKYGPEKFIALHTGSKGGHGLATALASGARKEGLPLGGYRARGEAVDEKYGRKVRLAFPRRTHPPAALIEYGRVMDHSTAMNIKMAEATVRGICKFVGKSYVPRKNSEVDYKVAVTWGGDADFGMAAMLAKKHAFKLLHVDDVVGEKYTVGYAVAVGKRRMDVLAHVGDGVALGGASRYETADQVYAKLMTENVSRTRPWG